MPNSLYETLFHKYFEFDSHILRREGAILDGRYFNVRTRSGELQILGGNEHVTPIDRLTTNELTVGARFHFDAWDLSAAKYFHVNTFDMLSLTHQLSVVKADETNLVVRSARAEFNIPRTLRDGELRFNPRVYTDAHPPETLVAANVGTVYTYARAALKGLCRIYMITDHISPTRPLAKDDRGSVVEVETGALVRIWSPSHDNPDRIQEALAKAANNVPGGKAMVYESVERISVDPPCVRCKQPFSAYRRRFKDVCGDCVVMGVPLVDQPVKVPVEPKKGPHGEAWETPSYDGVG